MSVNITSWIITVTFISLLLYLNRKDLFALFLRFMPYVWVKKICSSPTLVSFALRDIKYKTDYEQYGQIEYYAKPEEFWNRKAGDCEDYAFFVDDILSSHNHSVRTFSYEFSPTEWHTVAVATQYNRVFYVFDLANLIDVTATDFWDAIEKYTGKPKNKISEYAK